MLFLIYKLSEFPSAISQFPAAEFCFFPFPEVVPTSAFSSACPRAARGISQKISFWHISLPRQRLFCRFFPQSFLFVNFNKNRRASPFSGRLCGTDYEFFRLFCARTRSISFWVCMTSS